MNIWRKLRQQDRVDALESTVVDLRKMLDLANVENTDLARRLEAARVDAQKTGKQSQFLLRFISARHRPDHPAPVPLKAKVAVTALLLMSVSVFGQAFIRNPYDTNTTAAADARVSSLASTAAQAATNGFGWTNLPVPFASRASTATNAPNGLFLADTNMVNTSSNANRTLAIQTTNAAGIIQIVTNAPSPVAMKVGNAVVADSVSGGSGSGLTNLPIMYAGWMDPARNWIKNKWVGFSAAGASGSWQSSGSISRQTTTGSSAATSIPGNSLMGSIRYTGAASSNSVAQVVWNSDIFTEWKCTNANWVVAIVCAFPNVISNNVGIWFHNNGTLTSDNPVQSIGFRYDPRSGDTNWMAYTCPASGPTTFSTGVAFTTNAVVDAAIVHTPTSYTWYLNGSSVYTNSNSASWPQAANSALLVYPSVINTTLDANPAVLDAFGCYMELTR